MVDETNKRQQVELAWMRAKIRSAFVVLPAGRSDLGPMYSTTPDRRRRLAPVRNESDERRGQRMAELEAEIRGDWYRVRGRQSTKRRSCPPVEPVLAHIGVVRAVNELSAPFRGWLMYAYAVVDDYLAAWEDEAATVRFLWREIETSLGNVRESTRETMKAMTHLCVQDAKARKEDGEGCHSPAKLRELLKVSESNWRRDWSPRWRLMHSLMDALDVEALSQALEKVDRSPLYQALARLEKEREAEREYAELVESLRATLGPGNEQSVA